MQAGEKVAFIEQFDPFVEREAPTSAEKEAIFTSFVSLCDDLLNIDQANVKCKEFLVDGDFKKVFESSLRFQAEDGSYLHILPFAYVDSRGIYHMGIVVVMHDENGAGKEGYMYELKEGGHVVRSLLTPDRLLDEHDNNVTKHFSVIVQLEYMEKLEELSISDDIEDQLTAAEHLSVINERDSFEKISEEFGGSKSPTLSELTSLGELLLSSVPHPIEME